MGIGVGTVSNEWKWGAPVMRRRRVSNRNLTTRGNRLAMRRVESWSRCRRKEEDSGCDCCGGVEGWEC